LFLQWDILSNTGVVEEMFHLAKGQDPGNCVSLLRVNVSKLLLPSHPEHFHFFLVHARLILSKGLHIGKISHDSCVLLMHLTQPISANQSNMLILQECCTDESCSLVVYAPVDIAAMSTVLNGGDPESVALLPSGFAILPDGPPPIHDNNNSNSNISSNSNVMASTGPANSSSSAGSLLTVAFQILVDHVPTARLTLGSVATVNKLISNTVVRIKSALACEST
jgi:homeobox-leucine zipper protein